MTRRKVKALATCEFCGCAVELGQLLWHEAYHDQTRMLFETMERQLVLSNEAINLLESLIRDVEGAVDALSG